MEVRWVLRGDANDLLRERGRWGWLIVEGRGSLVLERSARGRADAHLPRCMIVPSIARRVR